MKTIINAINLMLINERYTYNMLINKVKMRLFIYIKKPIFRDLYIKVSSFALKEILPHYLKVINNIIKLYIKFFIITMRLSYIHIIKRRISEAAGIFKLEDIYFH